MDNKFTYIFNIVKTVQGLNLSSKFQSEKKNTFEKKALLASLMAHAGNPSTQVDEAEDCH